MYSFYFLLGKKLNFVKTHASMAKIGTLFPNFGIYLRKSGEYETNPGGREIRLKTERLARKSGGWECKLRALLLCHQH